MLPAFRSSALHALLISSVLTCTGVLAAPADSADAMSFSQARQQFHERADVFRADAADVERARHAADSAKALSGPKVDLVAMQVEGRKDIELNLEVPKGVQGLMPGMIPSSLSYSTEYDLSGPRAMISANWPIYTGGLITAQQTSSSTRFARHQPHRPRGLKLRMLNSPPVIGACSSRAPLRIFAGRCFPTKKKKCSAPSALKSRA